MTPRRSGSAALHDAAVRAVAEALDDALVVLLGKRLPTYPTALAGDILAVLTTNAEVRARLVAVVAKWGATEQVSAYTLKTPAEVRVVDAVLAALAAE